MARFVLKHGHNGDYLPEKTNYTDGEGVLMKQEQKRESGATGSARGSVILIHGLARRSRSLIPMAKALKKKGYRVVNLEYPSTSLCIEEIAEGFLERAVQVALQNTGPIHFVTHSLGGIIVRLYLEHTVCERLGRVVMLAPPNRGSELVDLLQDTFFFQMILGPAGQQLSTAQTSLPNRLGPVDFEVGIIAGSISFNPLSYFLFNGADDGKVAVSRTMLVGMRDMLVVRRNHTFIMRSRAVINQTLVFLESGEFSAAREENSRFSGRKCAAGSQPLQTSRHLSTTESGSKK